MGTGYVIMSVPKDVDMFFPLSHRLLWYKSEDEGFYACRVTCPFIVATTTLNIMLFLIVQKKHSFHACWKLNVSGHILAECTKSKNKPFMKARKTHTVSQDRMDNNEAQQNSPSTDTMFMVSPSTVPNTMKCKHSKMNWVATQEVLAALLLSSVNS